MGREVNKDCKVPYHGYLLNMTEWEEYQRVQKVLPDILDVLAEERKKNRSIKRC